MGRYLLFVFNSHNPNGGWYDFHGSFSTIEKAQHFLQTIAGASGDYHAGLGKYQIVDAEAPAIVDSGPLSKWLPKEQEG